MEAVCYRIPLSRPNLCGTNSRKLEDLTSLPVAHGIACRSGYDPKREAWGYIGLRSSSVLFEETSELLFFSTSCDIRTIGGFFFWTNSRKPLYTLNKMNVRQVTATATGADDFGDSD